MWWRGLSGLSSFGDMLRRNGIVSAVFVIDLVFIYSYRLLLTEG